MTNDDMTDADFLDDLERRIYADDWTSDETQRLWELSPFRIPPSDVRRAYSDNPERRRGLITSTREYFVHVVAKRLDQ